MNDDELFQSPGADQAIRRLIELRHSEDARDHEIVAAIDALEKALSASVSSASDAMKWPCKRVASAWDEHGRVMGTVPECVALRDKLRASDQTVALATDGGSSSFYLRAALDWIDAIPKEVADALPAMPGFDRDAAESAIKGVAYGDAD